MSIKVWWNENKASVAWAALACVWASAVVVMSQSDDRSRQKTIDVIEACEELHTFMHNGQRYYCAPWVRLPDAELPESPERIAEEDTTHA